jgi:hypothetical protein
MIRVRDPDSWSAAQRNVEHRQDAAGGKAGTAPWPAGRLGRALRWLASRLLFAYLLWTAMLFGIQRKILFPRHAVPDLLPGAREPAGLERLLLDIPEGQVEADLLPAPSASASQPRPAVIFAHGNAERIELWLEALEPYRRMGLSVLLPEYRGYGNSAGAPSEAAIAADFVAFYDRLVARPEVDPRRIVLHGRSLGGGAVCALARRRPAAALILESSFTSVRDLARRYWVPGFLVLDPFDNLAVVQSLDVPVLVAHGRRDELIGFEHAQALAEAAGPHGTLVAYDCGHNDFPPDLDLYFRELENFLRRHSLL